MTPNYKDQRRFVAVLSKYNPKQQLPFLEGAFSKTSYLLVIALLFPDMCVNKSKILQPLILCIISCSSNESNVMVLAPLY